MNTFIRLTVSIATTAILCMLFLVSFSVVSAQEPKPEPKPEPKSFRLVDVGDSYAITGTKELTSGVRLLLQNVTSTTITLRMQVNSLQPAGAKGEPIRLDISSKGQTDNPTTIVLAPAETTVITVKAPSLAPEPEPGDYIGLLVVWDEKRGRELSTTLRFHIPPKPDSAVATSLVESWTVNAYRGIPDVRFLREASSRGTISRQWQTVFLPIKSVSETLSLEKDKPLGILVLKDGDAASPVYWTGESNSVQISDTLTKTNPLPAGIVLAFSNFLRPGHYEGKIKLDPDGAGEVQLIVAVKDWFLYPLLVLLLGIALTWWLKQYTGVKRTINDCRVKEIELRQRFYRGTDGKSSLDGIIQAVKNRFWRDSAKTSASVSVKETFERETTSANPWAAYTIEADLCKVLQETKEALEKWKWNYLLVLDPTDADYVKAKDNLVQAEQAINEWNEFAADLKALDAALKEVNEDKYLAPYDPGQGKKYKPAFLKGSHLLLHPEEREGKGILKLSELHDLKPKVQRATELATKWPQLTETERAYETWIKKFESLQPPIEESDQKLLNRVRHTVHEAKWEIWHASDLEDLDMRTTELDLKQAERILAQLNFYLDKSVTEKPVADSKTASLEAARELPAREESADVDEPLPTLSESFRSVPAQTDSERIEQINRQRLYVDVVLVLMFLAVAVYAGMQELYFGNPYFGSLLDYTGVLLWGIGAKVSLDVAYGFLDRLYGILKVGSAAVK